MRLGAPLRGAVYGLALIGAVPVAWQAGNRKRSGTAGSGEAERLDDCPRIEELGLATGGRFSEGVIRVTTHPTPDAFRIVKSGKDRREAGVAPQLH